jgi:Flp pilus assembly protein TadD
VVLPLVLLVLDRWSLGRPWHRCLISAAPFFVAALAFTVITNNAQPVPAEVVPPFWKRPLVAGDALAFYMAKLAVPMNLGPDYGRQPTVVLNRWWGWVTWLAPVLAALLIGLRRKKEPWLVAAGLAGVAALLPVLGLIPFLYQIFSTVADRYVYLAMLGPAYAVACLLASRVNAKALYAGVAVVLAVWSALSMTQARYWDNTFALFWHELSVNDRSYTAYNLVGFHLDRMGKSADAAEYYRASLALCQNDENVHSNYGIALGELGYTDEAISEFREALRLNPNFAEAHSNLGYALGQKGQIPEALAECEESLRLKPAWAEARGAYGVVLIRAGRFDDAAGEFREALRLKPGYPQAQQMLDKLLAFKRP